MNRYKRHRKATETALIYIKLGKSSIWSLYYLEKKIISLSFRVFFLSLISDNLPALKNNYYQDCRYQQFCRHCVSFNTRQATVSVPDCAGIVIDTR